MPVSSHRHSLRVPMHPAGQLGQLVASVKKGRVVPLRRRLRAAPATVDARFDGRTLLHHCIRLRKLEAADLLLRAGADADAADDEGWTPLHDAVADGDGDAVSILLGAKADPSVSNRGWTPVHEAHALQHRELFLRLLGALEEIDEDAEIRWMQQVDACGVNLAVVRADQRRLRDLQRAERLSDRAVMLCDALVYNPLRKCCFGRWRRVVWARKSEERKMQRRSDAVRTLLTDVRIQSVPRVYFRRLRLHAPLSRARRAEEERAARRAANVQLLLSSNTSVHRRSVLRRLLGYTGVARERREQERAQQLRERLQVSDEVLRRGVLRLRRRYWMRMQRWLDGRRAHHCRRRRRLEMLAAVIDEAASAQRRRNGWSGLIVQRRRGLAAKASASLTFSSQQWHRRLRFYSLRTRALIREEGAGRAALQDAQRSEQDRFMAAPLFAANLAAQRRELTTSAMRKWRGWLMQRVAVRRACIAARATELVAASFGSLLRVRFENLRDHAARRVQARRALRSRQRPLAEGLLSRTDRRVRRRRYLLLCAFRRRRLLRGRQADMAAALERRNAAVVLRPRYAYLAGLQQVGADLRARHRRRAERRAKAEVLLAANNRRSRADRWRLMLLLASDARWRRRQSLRQRCTLLEGAVAALEVERDGLFQRVETAESEVRAMEAVNRQTALKAAQARAAAAETIQRAWRVFAAVREFRSRNGERQELSRRAAQIQRCFRRGKGRDTVRQLKYQQDSAARCIQLNWRRHHRCDVMPKRRFLESEREVVAKAEHLARQELRRLHRDLVLDVLQPAHRSVAAGMRKTVNQFGVVMHRWHTEDGVLGESAADVGRRSRQPSALLASLHTRPTVPAHARWSCPPNEWVGDQLFQMRRGSSRLRRPQTADLSQQTDWTVPCGDAWADAESSSVGPSPSVGGKRLAQRKGIGERPATCGSSRHPLQRGWRGELPSL
eukprot:TRINITY_DN7206_c1_g2_i1.p1 TRINITY_DN7206_c1_g2~~TRINITY_DN7206_c1_g2_i1.p1  ORF type:complete len:955 (+),score=302.46 TRINITY_DN7206_c1_g2_i1:48-2912(+)